MLMTVMAKPMELTIVNAVPRDDAGAFWATRVENKGESATTIIPQKIKKIRRISAAPNKKTRGEIRQQIPEKRSAIAAVFLVPILREI